MKNGAFGYEVTYGYCLTSFMGKPVIKINESDRDGKRVSQYEEEDGWLMLTIPLAPRLTVAVSYSF